MQRLLTALTIIAGLLLAAFGLGRNRGKNAAETKSAAEQASIQTEESQKHIEAIKNAVDAHQDVNSQSDADVSERLRQQWRRQGY